MPSSMVLERQTVIIEHLKEKLPLNLDELDLLDPDDLRKQIDQAVREVDVLHSETSSECYAPTRKYKDQLRQAHKESQEAQHKILRRMLTLLHMFALTQFGCGRRGFQRNLMKRTPKGNHWGDLRARLEVAIKQVMELASKQEPVCVDSDYTSDSEDTPVVLCNEKLTTAVRKDLASALRDLIQHGLMQVGQSSSLVPLGCLSLRSTNAPSLLHAWDLVLRYYEIKENAWFFSCWYQALLAAIHNIISSHTPLKRSYDSHFKAFVCAALNEKRLTSWLRLMFKCRPLVERYYVHWSYVRKTGFEDALRSLDSLAAFDFDLPVDLAIRQLQNMKDAF
ncbi:hypothetical protein HPB47_011148 [Ixodes persulcatus]|uniref:Uncharacterized protein n=1 Tax=Ixodes persulcatus TaxID=34615 RepID=A0AC60NX94_IXOPE|nr:hypothetical protein HPB47_011148 [Ixodes persulcatus]